MLTSIILHIALECVVNPVRFAYVYNPQYHNYNVNRRYNQDHFIQSGKQKEE